MSVDAGPLKKHRHDLGHEDHGPVMAVRTTRGIQAVLALVLALTAGALVWAAIDGFSQLRTVRDIAQARGMEQGDVGYRPRQRQEAGRA